VVEVEEEAPVELEAAGTFAEFFAAEYARLARALFLVPGDRAESEDLAHEAMARVCERWQRVSRMSSPTGYVYRTALNLNRKRLRWLMVRSRGNLFPASVVPGPTEAIETSSEVKGLLASVPRGQREALVLVEWIGLSAGEAGKVLGVGASTVRARISRAKAVIRERHGGSHD
jgi:RNA polymerase sigma factor (sigma-70 family)